VIFPKWTNWIPYVVPVFAGGGLLTVVFVFWYWGSDKNLVVGYQPEQPIKYSHKLHVNDLGIDCRYCHFNVERSPVAGVPPTEVCMNCHTKILTDSPEIKKLTEFHQNNIPVPWQRVHDLPDYAYFDHSAHVNKGVSCLECHGRIDQMVEVRHAEPLSMSWCLDCHKNPAPHLRDKKLVTRLSWHPEKDGLDAEEYGMKYFKKYHVNTRMDCSTCHR